ncbi:antibiotic biosynthesis monooxygenase [Pseudoalteromonas rubra]|uniref:Antibiotic biosynthesis monooxygenase n=1 Tax=Pseudoalteromonas rubra TaxID=43658 RepID=A0A5S3WFV2_9GAMM|nr:antibiotic biosynthesis monooxygenase [Pseudoalteromonas rubra]TMP25247.1 antibiotic biosynthesis monooxygenase [Pseudoalteromonas rubra]TMP35630.1 antibiotic biosynthesis monooxygenase [Pseudoalteromonas rubra]
MTHDNAPNDLPQHDGAVNLVAYINPKADCYQDCKAAIEAIVEVTRCEPGCQRFELYENKEQSQLTLIEQFSRRHDFDFHHAQPYTQKVYQLYEQALATPVELHFMTELDV